MQTEVISHGNKYKGESISCPECTLWCGHVNPADYEDEPININEIKKTCPHCKCVFKVKLY